MYIRSTLALLLLFAASPGFARAVQCELYTVENGLKKDRTIFQFKLASAGTSVVYEKLSGPDWFLPSGSKLDVVWISEDKLRAVVMWENSAYGADKSAWHPIYVVDIDLAKPRFEYNTFGGFSDFDTVIFDPWNSECRRVD